MASYKYDMIHPHSSIQSSTVATFSTSDNQQNMAIPVIDFSKVNGPDRAKALAEIENGCAEWGFFQLVNHGISEELLERVKKVCTMCYETEREEKFKTSTPVRLLNELVENKSGEKLENVDWEDVFCLFDDNEWPSGTPGFKETMAEYRAELEKLAVNLLEIMDENLGLPIGHIKKLFSGADKPFFGTKVSHYPPCPQSNLVNGLRAHTDAGGVILLFQDDEVGGLQILKDNQWIDVQPLKNSIVINTGDQIEVLSNGKYKSVWHRVLASYNGNRRSIASFYNPSLKATIASAAQLAEQDVAYPKFLFEDYMNVYAEQKFQAKEPRFQAAATM